MIAQVIINSNVKNLNKIFDYNVPTNLVGTICIGDRVLVQFGNKKTLEEGFVIGFKERSNYKLKHIQKIENEINLTKENIELAILMSRRYATWGQTQTGNFCHLGSGLTRKRYPEKNKKIL